MVSHNADGQMLGYLYQVRYALYLLLKENDTEYQISIEKYDDIAFEEDGTPIQLIQLKHHVTPASLSDASIDLWRTLNVWIDAIAKDKTLLDHTDFVIVTTAAIPVDSVAEAIKEGNYAKAFDTLKSIAKNGTQTTNKKFYDNFKSQDESILIQLINRIHILSGNYIGDVEDDIKKEIKYSCKPEHISMVTERIEGWWFKECIKALTSDKPVITSQQIIHSKVHEISRQYDEDNLPIEFWELEPKDESTLDPQERIFLEQLKLLAYKSRILQLAIQDYYRATYQRSSWIRQGLIYANDLEKYEYKLKDAWAHAFARMEEDLSIYGEPTENEKIRAGRLLYENIMEKDIRIRPMVDANYVMQGTYHMIANSLDVGWRIDFFEKLRHLLEGME